MENVFWIVIGSLVVKAIENGAPVVSEILTAVAKEFMRTRWTKWTPLLNFGVKHGFVKTMRVAAPARG